MDKGAWCFDIETTGLLDDSTVDLIKTKASGQEKYAKGWEAIFGKKEDMMEQLAVFEEEHVAVPFMEEEPTVLVFTEQLLPEGIIGDEV